MKRPPFVRLQAPVVWTTLALTMHADGSVAFEVTGASPFPRHWVYDDDGALAAKVGLADFKGWYHGEQGRHTPWGDEDTPALVTAVETALERELSTQIMRSGAKPRTCADLKAGATLTEQGAEGDELYLLLDGVLAVEVDGARGGRGRPRRGGGRAGRAGGRPSHLDPAGPDPSAGGRGPRRPDRPPRPWPGWSAATGRESLAPGLLRVRLALLGVRGSTPAPGHEFAEVGGNTACVAIGPDDGAPRLVLDAGTGLRRLTGQLAGAAFVGHDPVDPPALGPRPGAAVLRRRRPRRRRGQALSCPIRATRWRCCVEPCRRPTSRSVPRAFAAHWTFDGLAPGRHRIEDFEVLARHGRPQGRPHLRLPDLGRLGASVAYLPDHALTPDRRLATTGSRAPRSWSTGVDVLIHDAQFIDAEEAVARDYGHATVEAALALARRGRVGRLVLFHHSPDRTDAERGGPGRCAGTCPAERPMTMSRWRWRWGPRRR